MKASAGFALVVLALLLVAIGYVLSCERAEMAKAAGVLGGGETDIMRMAIPLGPGQN
jgi:hypothetical protein